MSVRVSILAGIALLTLSAPLAVSAQHVSPALTRGEFVRMSFDIRPDLKERVQAYRHRRSRLPLFSDVPQSHELAPYMEVAFARHIMTGFDDRTFRPENPMTAEEVVVLAMQIFNQNVPAVAEGEEWFVPAIRSALTRNLIADPRSLSVGGPISQAQFADLLVRLDAVVTQNMPSYIEPGAAPAMGALVLEDPNQGIPTDAEVTVVARAVDNAQEIAENGSQKPFAITIPSLGIKDLTVTHPVDPSTQDGLLSVLKDGVGHLLSDPGRGGKIMIYGHSSGYSWDVSQYTKIFRQIHKLQAGDKVYVSRDGQLFAYTVTGQRVISPNDQSPFDGRGEELVLYTCWPVGSNKSRLIVTAMPVETVAVR